MQPLELARQFIQALESGETEIARGCFTADARIWHNFDDVSQTVDENMKLFEWMKRKFTTRRYEITRLEEVSGGYLQQHVLRMTDRNGIEVSMHACVIVRVKEGKIDRIEEYLDPAPTGTLG